MSGFLTDEDTRMRCKEAAAELRMSEVAVRVAIHRMRKRFGELLRAEIARTINDPKEVNDEIREILAKKPKIDLLRRAAMVEVQLRQRGILDPNLIDVFQEVPRHEFVRPVRKPESCSTHITGQTFLLVRLYN